MNKILSISVAAYNVENFIEKNLKSFIESNVSEKIEVIVTDDGSKDETMKIIQKYVESYPNVIKLVSQKNAGPGSTVNSGIENATGKYFRMVDGDDWVNTENLDSYIEFLEKNNADLVATNYSLVDNETYKEIPQKLNINVDYNKVMRFEDVCLNLKLQMHNITYKTSILKDNKIKLDNCFYTDVEYIILPTEFIETIAFIDSIIYMYRVSLSTQSTSMESMKRNIDMHDLVLNRLIKVYEEAAKNDDINKNKLKYMANRISNMARTQLSTLLSFKPSKENKEKIKKFNKKLKKDSKEIYNIYSSRKITFLLIRSNYLFYFPIAYGYNIIKK